MTIQNQIEFMQELEKRFLDLDHTYLRFETYDGHYAEYAEKAGYVIESLWRLSELEK